MIYRTDIAWRALCRVASAAVTALVLCGSLATGAIANGNHHMRCPYTYGRGWNYGIGWGWDSIYGYYQGPIFGKNGLGYFRCFEPGYGCHPCPNYWIVPMRRYWW